MVLHNEPREDPLRLRKLAVSRVVRSIEENSDLTKDAWRKVQVGRTSGMALRNEQTVR